MSVPPEANFDYVAHVYRWAEYMALGPLLQRTRTHFIPLLLGSRNAWVVGDGDGRFLAAFLRQNLTLQAVAVDSSKRMLALLQKRCARDARRLSTVHSLASLTEPPVETDLIVTHFFLDCLTQADAQAFIKQTASLCRPGTLWLISDFHVPENSLWTYPARAYIRALYSAFRLLTGLRVTELPNARAVLHGCGFTRRAWHHRLRGFLYTEVWVLGTAATLQGAHTTLVRSRHIHQRDAP